MAGKLTAKQAAFVSEYLVDLNASAAARRAGYSPRTANRAGHENLTKPDIAAAVAAAQEARAERLQITATEVLENLLRIAKGEDEYEQINGLGIEVVHFPKYPDRLKAWELIGKHLGMFTDKVEHSGEQCLTVRVEYEDPQVRPE